MAGTVSALAATVRQRGVSSLGRVSLPLLCASQPSVYSQKRGFVSNNLREPSYKRPAPFPYKTKTYNLWRALFDDVTQRFDENSKLVVIDGPPTGNKSKFAKEVAKELDMLYIPPAHLDMKYVNFYGKDFRDQNAKLPECARSFDVNQFLQDPTNKKTANMQFEMMYVRFNQYIDAINHLLNTGQGVVLHRSLYSDAVFVNTMTECGFLSRKAKNFYYECLEQAMMEFMRPHLIIYLDIPVDQIIKNVKARNRPEEVNSKFYTPEVLTVMEKYYKKNYLKTMEEHAEVMVYDWSEEGEAEVVVEDMCRLDLEKYHSYQDVKMSDWYFEQEWDWKYKRIMFSSHRHYMADCLDVPKFEVDEMILDGEQAETYIGVLRQSPGNMYLPGFNKDMGDNFLFKLKPDDKGDKTLY